MHSSGWFEYVGCSRLKEDTPPIKSVSFVYTKSALYVAASTRFLHGNTAERLRTDGCADNTELIYTTAIRGMPTATRDSH
jgi:hypothetical protein